MSSKRTESPVQVFPLVFVAAGMSIQEIGVLAAACPATWGLAQLGTGPLSDKVVYRLWRDLGYVAGAILVGVIADRLGIVTAMWAVATLTFVSGAAAALRMTETLHSKDPFIKEGSKPWLFPAR